MKDLQNKSRIDGEIAVLDIAGRKARRTLGYSPCLTRTRCGGGGFYVPILERHMLLEQMLMLQVFIAGYGRFAD